MAMNYTTLVADVTTPGSIKSLINWSRFDAASVLEDAQAWIYGKVRVRQMMATANVTISSAASTASFPTGYLDPIHLGIPGYNNTLRLKDAEWFRSHLGWDQSAVMPEGVPSYWCDFDETIQFDTKADQTYTAKMVYFKTPTALGVSNETNWLTVKYPHLLRQVCRMFAAIERKEMDTVQMAELRAYQTIDEIKIESDLAMRGWEADMNWEENS